MEKEKQIEEIKQTMVRSCNVNRLYFEQMAEDLYNAGYGDTKQAVKEFAERLKERLKLNITGYWVYAKINKTIIDELVKEVYND